MSTGSLGQGFSVAVGMAMAGKLDEAVGKASGRVYTLLGDGELQEGLVWEAAMAAAHYRLDNLCACLLYTSGTHGGGVRGRRLVTAACPIGYSFSGGACPPTA